MEKSTNYNFNLPNSANDEPADINDISDNFRIIDSIMNETDQTFEPTSTKAASGKAVKEAIDGVQPIDENTEFIFDGGNADGAIPVDIVIDSALSKTSTNAIQNKAVTTKFDEILDDVKATTAATIAQSKAEIILSAYPVGAIFISVVNTNPATLFGGTWERIAKGRTLIGVDENDTDFATIEKTGGEKTHTLTVNEIPSHTHTATKSLWGNFQTGETLSSHNKPTETDYFYSDTTDFISATGGGEAHNNIPPYLTVYMWKRTA